ncbi:MAG: AlkA N-terminal domain-containing protein [Lysobacteraceae bacterium]
MSLLDSDICYRQLCARDAVADGRFFVAVRTTGVYCRPICPARTPRRENCDFHRTAAAAEQAGYRPCLRCRPELAPAHWPVLDSESRLGRALALMSDGIMERGGVAALAEAMRLGPRQLGRLFNAELGVTPSALWQTQRLLLAKQLLHDSALSITDIAMAAGFRSLRRFNEHFLAVHGQPPSRLRRQRAAPTGLPLRLGYRGAYDWQAMLDFLRMRAWSGMEVIASGCYHRAVMFDGVVGALRVSHLPHRQALQVEWHGVAPRRLPTLLRKVRRLFDLDADLPSIEAHLRADPALAARIDARPGLRLPGAWSVFEAGLRALLGQQITVSAARRLGDSLLGRMRRSAAGTAMGVCIAFCLSRRRYCPRTCVRCAAAGAASGDRTMAFHQASPSAIRQRGTITAGLQVPAGSARHRRPDAHYTSYAACANPMPFLASDIGRYRR